MSSFLESLGTRVLLADGDLSTCLEAPPGMPAEALVISNPEAVERAHQSFLSAGAQIVRTLSRSASRPALESSGLADHAAELLWQSAQIARSAARPFKAWVAASVGPLPVGVPDPTAAFRLQIGALLDGGCDLVCLDGFEDPEALLLALQIKQELHHCPVICVTGPAFPEESLTLLAREGAEVIAPPFLVTDIEERIRSLGSAMALFPGASDEPPAESWHAAAQRLDLLGGGRGISPKQIAAWHASLHPGEKDHTA